MEQQNAVRGDDTTAARRKSLGRLLDMSVAWDIDPQGNKYTRNDDTEPCCPSSRIANSEPRPSGDGLVDVELTRNPSNMSAMEMESIKERERASMLRKCAQHLELESVNGKFTRENFKRGILNKEVLSILFQLFDKDNEKVLVQEQWIQSLKERLLEEKQGDLAEQLESVAYVLCGDQPINLQKFYQIFQAKGIVEKVFRLIDKDSDGIITPPQAMDLITTITYSSRVKSGFDSENLMWLEQLFRQTVGNELEIKRDDFNKILITKNPFFTERVFQIFDKDNSGSISLHEFLDAMHQFAGQTPDDKIRFLFKVYDLDGDGLIQHRELQHVMRACMEENGMQFSEDQVEDLTMALFEDADSESRGAITYEALKNQLQKHNGLLENLSISIDRWLVPPKPKQAPASAWGKFTTFRPYQLTLPYMRNNYVYLIFLAVYVLVNAILFGTRIYQYRNSNMYTIFARACGQCLNFNCTFVLVLMLRHCITFLRTRGLSLFLPLDQHIYFHKITGFFIFGYSILHTCMHLLNFSTVIIYDPNLNYEGFTVSEWLLTTDPELFGLVAGYANPTGVLLIVILFVMFICSQPFVRRGGCFEIFYWTHLLYVPFYLLLILHCPNFWKWLVIPGLLYLCERFYRFSLMRSEHGKTYISSGLLLPSKVTHLVIKRPPHFDFHPGDYIFVNIPAIAKYEWHPFTISSAPEQEDYMWLHIRGVGEWTNRLYSYFEEEQHKLHLLNEELPGSVNSKTSTVDTLESSKMKKLQTTLQRTFSGRTIEEPTKGKYKRGSDFSYTNQSFSSLPEDFHIRGSENDVNSGNPKSAMDTRKSVKKAPNTNLHKLVLINKAPLSKSLSMPDMDNRIKKRERLLALRTYMRSESEKSFDECQMKRARLQSLGLMYLSPQNKSLAQSFRYMRHKPTIIAFKTPSLENCETKVSSYSIAIETGSNIGSMEYVTNESKSNERSNEDNSGQSPMNYPVGKPLEVS
ncbi:Hypothetical protein CINCED_3A001760 [Cinara cedri]|uniref:NADPH oxidase 5 n=1 Tax=Cinara cedri TaxID=506608 RepID=A0A5E4N3N1_9HEMI|nr:Hypothetical protein CINCED_3A001760 [Cinara cedri]